MPKEKLRLGGMALANGVLVHGPTSWACAVRTDDGELKVVARKKRVIGSRFSTPLLRGPAKLVESVVFLPELKLALPEAKLPFARRSVAGAVLGSVIVIQGVRRSRLGDAAKELVAGLLSVAPAVLSLREGEVAAYHGAEHITIGTYEHGSDRAKEHERCGTHLVGPLIATTAAANALAAKAPAHLRSAARAFAALGSLAASTEIFAWMQRHPEHIVARALAKPGHEFQHRVATDEPTRDQLDVAEAALRACLELEEPA
ncbi:MAG TPA: DUF1385 domain-containing protein [Gaiellaceae bacterium]